MATAMPIADIQEPGIDSAKTVFIKLHLGLLGSSRKVSSSQVEVAADKALIRVSKTRSTHRSSKPFARWMVTSARYKIETRAASVEWISTVLEQYVSCDRRALQPSALRPQRAPSPIVNYG
jgi:hypothetical protein